MMTAYPSKLRFTQFFSETISILFSPLILGIFFSLTLQLQLDAKPSDPDKLSNSSEVVTCYAPQASIRTKQADCGAHNGVIYVDGIGGGVHTHYYSLNGRNFAGPYDTYTISSLDAGHYTVYVSTNPHYASCTVAYNVDVPRGSCAPACSQPTATFNVVQADCNQHNGKILVNASGGGAAHHYYAMAGNHYDGPYDSYHFTNLDAGNYTIYVSSNPHEASCARAYTVNVPEKDCGPTCSPPTATYSVTKADCGKHNGKIYIDASGGGANGHYYALAGQHYDGPYSSYTFNALDPGQYTVYVSSNPHEASCDRAYTIVVPEKDCGPTCSPPTATYSVTKADCGSNNGKIYIDASGGGTNGHYYALAGQNYDGPFSSYTFNSLAPGHYTVFVSSDPHESSCERSYIITVTGHSKPDVHAGSDRNICPGESIQLCATGADRYLWNNGSTNRCIIVSPNNTTTYSVTGTTDGCSDTDDVKVIIDDCGPGTCQVDLGPDIDLCSGIETCNAVNLTGLDASNDAVNEVNNGNVKIGDARLTINQSFRGTSQLDENAITASQTTGALGISAGVKHRSNLNSDGGPNNAMVNSYDFDVPVCNLEIEIWDMDRNDEMVLTAIGPNGAVTYTVTENGSSVSVSGNTFTSVAGDANYPRDGSATLGRFTIVFDDCVSQIQTLFYDISNDEGDGGSYTIVFNEGCTDVQLVSGAILTPNFSSQPACSESTLSYNWSTGSTDRTINVTQPGTYSVTITDCTGCVAIDNIVVTVGADSGTLTLNGDSPVRVCEGELAMISATPDGNIVVPAGFEVIYVLTSGPQLIIEAVNASPEFEVAAPGSYTIHTLVYDPNTLDLGIVQLGVTTGFDVNGLLIQGGGDICASLDVAGAPVTVEALTPGDAGMIAEGSQDVCLVQGGSVTRNVMLTGQVVPDGDSLVLILVDTTGSILDVTGETSFDITSIGVYTIHPVVYNPTACDVYALSTVAEVLECDCVAINVVGVTIDVEECCNARSGILTNPDFSCVTPASNITTIFTAIPMNETVPAGFTRLFILTDEQTSIVLDTNDMPEFEIINPGTYKMHTLVYNEATLDLSSLTIGTDPINSIVPLIRNQGACASIDLLGLEITVIECDPNFSECPENLYVPGPSNAVESGLYESSKSISSDGLIMAGDVEYSAGEDIELMPGFEVMPGHTFNAVIGGCTPNQ